MPENDYILGADFNVETVQQTVYGSIYAYGDIVTSGSIMMGNTGSLPTGVGYNIPVGTLITLVLEGESTGSLYFYNGNDYVKLNTNTNFNYAFANDPTDVTFVTIPTGSNNERAFTFKYTLTSGSAAINAGQGQVVGDGSGIALINLFNTSSAFGSVSPTFAANYNGSGIAISASFIGSDYIISGSYSSVI